MKYAHGAGSIDRVHQCPFPGNHGLGKPCPPNLMHDCLNSFYRSSYSAALFSAAPSFIVRGLQADYRSMCHHLLVYQSPVLEINNPCFLIERSIIPKPSRSRMTEVAVHARSFVERLHPVFSWFGPFHAGGFRINFFE